MVPLGAGLAALAAPWSIRAWGWPLSHNDFLTLMALAFVCFLTGVGFFFLGRKWMAAVAFPIAFLIFMVPLPDRAVESHCMLPRRHSRLWRYVIWKSVTQIEVSETSGSGLDGPT